MDNKSAAPKWTTGKDVRKFDNRHQIDEWLKIAEGVEIDGVLVHQYSWKDDEGDDRHTFIVQTSDKMFGISEIANLRGLREAPDGSQVYFKVMGKKDIGKGRSTWDLDGPYVKAPANGKKTFETEALPIS